jgi:hypothetical protein
MATISSSAALSRSAAVALGWAASRSKRAWQLHGGGGIRTYVVAAPVANEIWSRDFMHYRTTPRKRAGDQGVYALM